MNSEEIKKLIDSNSNYWEKRALQNKLNIVENEEDYIKRLSSIYDEAMNQIDEKLAIIYARYADNNKMTLKQAYKKLPKDMNKKYINDVNKYVERAKAYNGNPKEMQYLLNQSLMHQHSVLDQLRTEYREVVYNIDEEYMGGKFLSKIYKNANYYAQYNGNETFAHVSQDRIEALLKENWSGGGNFSQNIWKNKEQLINALDDVVMKGLAVGTSYEKMSKDLADRMNTSKSNAKRLIMTESARMDNEGLLDYYKRTNVEQIEFLATLDMKTSEICRAMDGKIINIEDAHIGLNVPPMHPYCRSVIMPYYNFDIDNERIYKDANGKNKMGKNRTYVQYLEQELGDMEQAKALANTSNTLNNLVKAVGTIFGKPTIINKTNSNVNITNPNQVNKLPNEDRDTLLSMKGPKINEINNTLANNLEITKAMEAEMKKIDNAMDKLPFYQGDVTTDISPKANNPLNNYKVGDIWKVKKYLFSTKNKEYYKNATIRYMIKSKTGKDIGSKLDNYKVNKEVIFKRNSIFIINDIKTKNNIVYYYLEELV